MSKKEDDRFIEIMMLVNGGMKVNRACNSDAERKWFCRKRQKMENQERERLRPPAIANECAATSQDIVSYDQRVERLEERLLRLVETNFEMPSYQRLVMWFIEANIQKYNPRIKKESNEMTEDEYKKLWDKFEGKSRKNENS